LSVEPTVACITVCISSHGVPTAANNVVEPYDNEEDFDNIEGGKYLMKALQGGSLPVELSTTA